MHSGKKQNNGSFKKWLAPIDGGGVIKDEAWGGNYCVKLIGQDSSEVTAGNSSGRLAVIEKAMPKAMQALREKLMAPIPKAKAKVVQKVVQKVVPSREQPTMLAGRPANSQVRSAGPKSPGPVSRSTPRPTVSTKPVGLQTGARSRSPRGRPGAGASPELPYGWEKHWDENYGLHYYFNIL